MRILSFMLVKQTKKVVSGAYLETSHNTTSGSVTNV
jgi:hypothetical protein